MSQPSAPTPSALPPLPPALPERAPARFQFNLKHLLAFMFVSALLAAGMRLLIQALERLPDGYVASWFNVLVSSLLFGAAAYFLVRGPFLAWHAARLTRRWQVVQSHRRELNRWAEDRQAEERIIDKRDDHQRSSRQE